MKKPLQPRTQARLTWYIEHPWRFAAIETGVGMLLTMVLLWLIGASLMEALVFSGVAGAVSFPYIGWSFSRGRAARKIRRLLSDQPDPLDVLDPG